MWNACKQLLETQSTFSSRIENIIGVIKVFQTLNLNYLVLFASCLKCFKLPTSVNDKNITIGDNICKNVFSDDTFEHIFNKKSFATCKTFPKFNIFFFAFKLQILQTN